LNEHLAKNRTIDKKSLRTFITQASELKSVMT